MTNITIEIQLFGALRKYGDSVSVSLPAGGSIASLKQALGLKLKDDPLVLDSVVASDEEILPEDFIVSSDKRLSILPPVCGG